MTARTRSFHARRGVTLLEVLLAIAILIFVMTMTFWFYSSVLETRDRSTAHANNLQLMRVVLDRVADELRQAVPLTNGGEPGVDGDAESIRIITTRVPTRDVNRDVSLIENDSIGQFDLAVVEYRIARHPDILDEDGYEMALGLNRTEYRVPPKNLVSARTGASFEEITSGEEGEDRVLIEDVEEVGSDDEALIDWTSLYSPDIRWLRFCYFDGAAWWDEWHVTGESPLPQAILITAGFSPKPPFGEEMGYGIEEEFCICQNMDPVECEPLEPDQYSVLVRLPQADPFYRSRVTRESQSLLEELGL